MNELHCAICERAITDGDGYYYRLTDPHVDGTNATLNICPDCASVKTIQNLSDDGYIAVIDMAGDVIEVTGAVVVS